MNPSKPHLQISICTYKRPIMLQACLESLARMEFPADAFTIVVVIDNTAQRSAEPIIAGLQNTFPVPLHYDCEPHRGISMARNRAIDVAKHKGADHIIFLDDDEQADPNWLMSLCDFAKSTGWQSIIHGEVIAVLPPETPSYLARYFQTEPFPTGAKLKICATNNVMIPMDLVHQFGLRFDERFGLTGGEDTAFFLEAVARGASIFQCNEAMIRETIPESKATLSWLSRRQCRNGMQYIELWGMPKRLIPAIYRAISRFLRSGVAAMRGKNERAADLWLKAWASTGIVCGLMGIQINEYDKTHGH